MAWYIIRVVYAFLTVYFCGQVGTLAVFIHAPSNVNATLNETVLFQCLNPAAESYSWIVNNVVQDPLSPQSDIPLSFNVINGTQIMSVVCDESLLTRTTRVICRTRSAGGQIQRSDTAILMVQGRLSYVSSMEISSNATAINLTWVPPYSLDITGVDPDFTYIVTVQNITSGQSIATITKITANFTFSLADPNPSDLFEFVVYAVNAVGIGEPSQPVQGRFKEAVCNPPCKNGGTCKPSSTCSCLDTFMGDYCESHRKEANVLPIIVGSSVGTIILVTLVVVLTGIMYIIYRVKPFHKHTQTAAVSTVQTTSSAPAQDFRQGDRPEEIDLELQEHNIIPTLYQEKRLIVSDGDSLESTSLPALDPEASTQLQVPSEYQDGEYVQFIR